MKNLQAKLTGYLLYIVFYLSIDAEYASDFMKYLIENQ